MRYHAKRRRFFENLYNFINAIVVLTGSTAFMSLLSSTGGSTTIPLYLTSITALLTTLELIYGFFKKSIKHDELYKKFSILLKETIVHPLTTHNLTQWQAEKIMIESEQPTCLKVLHILCHNEHAVALGYGEEEQYKLGWRTLLKDWWSFESFRPIKNKN